MNADRTVSATLVAKVAGFTGPMSTASKSSASLAASVARSEKQIQQEMIRTGATAKARGSAAVGALSGLAATSGMFGPLGGALSQVQMGLQGIEGVGKRTGATMIGVGAAAAGAGLLMVHSAEKDVQAHKQLEAAVRASGHAYEPYAKGVEDAIHTQEHFGHTADDTQEALRRLTQSTGDPAKALAHMGVVANLAAAQHISLAEASTMVSRVLAGKGGRALAQYGITMDTSIKDPSQRGAAALDQLSKKLDGQASSSVDSFSGRMKVLKTQAEDAFNTIGAKVGPVLTAVGPLFAVAGAAAEIMGARASRAALAATTLAASEAEASVATAALAETELTAAGSASAMSIATARAAVANEALGGSSAVASTGVSRLAGSLGIAGVAAAASIGVGIGIDKLVGLIQNKAEPSVTKLTGDLKLLGETGQRGATLDKFFGDGKFMTDFKAASDDSNWRKLAGGMDTVMKKTVPLSHVLPLLGIDLHKTDKDTKALADSLAGLSADQAIATFARLTEGLKPAAVERFKASLIKLNPALDGLLNRAAAAAPALSAAAAAAGALARGFDKLSANASVDKAIIAAADASRTFADTLKSSGHAMDLNTVKGGALRSGLIDIAAANKNVYDQMIAAHVPADVAAAAYNKLTVKLRAQMLAAHYTNAEIDKLLGRYSTHIPTAAETAAKAVVALNVKFAAQRVAAENDSDSHDRLGRSFATVAGNARKIPPKVSTSVSTPGLSASEAAMRTYLGYLRGVPARIVTDIISTHHDSFGAGSATGGPVHRAAGGPSGFLTGPGTATSDSIPMMLSNGEYVQKAAAVVKYGRPFMDSVNAGTYRPTAYTPGQSRTELHPADRQLMRQLVSSGMTYSPTVINPLPERASDSAVVNLRRLQYAIRP